MSEDVHVQDKDIWMAAASFFAVIVTIGLLVVNMVLVSRQARFAQVNRDAICAYANSVRTQRDQSIKFLANGGHIPGVPNSLLQRGIQQQTKTIEALREAKCPVTKP